MADFMQSSGSRAASGCLSAVLAVAAATAPLADAQAADAPYDWKLTLGEYFYSGFSGTDVNLRWRASDTSAWIGVYSDSQFGTQLRTGADTSLQVAKYLQIQPSLQLASRGFIGGSVNLQVGGDTYAVVGIGRTDTRPYFNLNFDPNDALTFGIGHNTDNGMSYGVSLIEDDRFHTGQRDWHATASIPSNSGHTTFDILYKTGLSDVGRISGWGVSVNHEWSRWFMRLAYDPYQNFSAQNSWRVSGGVRF